MNSRNLALVSALCLATLTVSAQHFSTELIRHIPESHRSHPELGQHVPHRRGAENGLEMVHQRTRHTRTFLHPDGTQTTSSSSVPLHYMDSNAQWRTLDHKVSPIDAHTYGFPAQEPVITFDTRDHSVTFMSEEQPVLTIGSDLRVTLLDNEGKGLTAYGSEPGSSIITAEGQHLVSVGLLPGMAVEYLFFHGLQKTNYIIHEVFTFPQGTASLSLMQELRLPDQGC